MPQIVRPDGAVIHYDVQGRGPPLLALAPGGVSSAADRWDASLLGALEPLSPRFTVIRMDQRHAGRSRAPLAPFDYDEVLGDQLAVLDAAGVGRAHVLAADFGCAQALRLAYEAPVRVGAVALLEPVGLDASLTIDAYYARFNETIRVARADGLEAVIEAAIANGCFAEHPAAGPWAQRLHDEPPFRDALRSLGRETYITLVVDFRDGFCPWGRRYFSLNDAAVNRPGAPFAVLPGADRLHPPGVAAALGAELRSAETLPAGMQGAALTEALVAFFTAHTQTNFEQENEQATEDT